MVCLVECLEGGICVKRFKNVVTDLEARCKRLGLQPQVKGLSRKVAKSNNGVIMINDRRQAGYF